MEQKYCTFVKRNQHFQGEFHPLHLRSDKVKWISVFGRCNSPCIASLCYDKGAYHSNKTKFFVLVHLDHHAGQCQEENQVSLDVEDYQSDDEIVLLSTDEFHHHYGIGEGCKSLVVGLVNVFPLSRVILSAQTDETFHWANSLTFERGLMVTGTCQKNLLVRQGDQFLAAPTKIFGDNVLTSLHHFQNLTTLECYPVKQGYIHAKTEVIITDGRNRGNQDHPPSRRVHEGIKVELLTRDILKNLIGPFDHQNDVICCAELAEKLSIGDGDMIKLEVSFHNSNEHQDNDPIAFASSGEPACDQQEEEYFSIDMPQQVEVKNENQGTPQIITVSRLRVGYPRLSNVLFDDSRELDQVTLYISPLLWFNASYTGHFPERLEEIEVKIEKISEDRVPYAKEIHLSLVLSPHYSPSVQFDQTLMKHLSKTRIFKKNDVISIETQGNVEFLCECDAKESRCNGLHYKVKKFGEVDETSSHTHFRVNMKRTSLYQVGTINSFVPRTIPASANSNVPSGLSNYVDEMKKILAPFVKGEMDMSTATVLLSGASGCGKKSIISSVASLLNLHLLNINCHELMSDSSGATEAKINTAMQRATVYAPCMVVLGGIECIGKDTETGQADHRVCIALQNAIENLWSEEHPIAVVAVTSNSAAVVSKIRSLFLHQVEIKSLSETERQKTLQQLITLIPSGKDIDVNWIAKHTVGFTHGELWALIRYAIANARERIAAECAIGSRLSWMDEIFICSAGISTQHCDFIKALQKMQSQRADIIGVPKIPDVKWDDIGGLEDVKNTIKDTIQLPLDHPELVSAGLRRSGILLYGPPGTGKTLLAKAVATQCSLSFLSVKGPELINMYVGQSEENVRKVFSRARDAAPCVIFFDELDSLAPNRGRSGDSGGVMDRVVSQLLAELDGLVESDAEKQVFVIGASNRPDLIDPALLRPGRFDKLLYVGINTDKIDQLKILAAQTRRANLSPAVRLDEIVELCPDNMTGADFYALTSDAMMNALRRRIGIEEAREKDAEDEKSDLVVEQTDFEKAARNISPSVSAKELVRFQEIQNQLTSL